MHTNVHFGKWGCALSLALAAAVQAAPKYNFEHGANLGALSIQISNTDMIHALPAGSILLNGDLAAGWPYNTNGYDPISNMPDPCASTEALQADTARNPGISGFHYAFNPPDQKLKLVDGQAGVNTDCVLSDLAWPAAVFQFDLPDAPRDIGEIRVFAANADLDGRVWQNYDVEISTDSNPVTKERVFTPLIDRVMTSIVVCAAPGQGDGFAPNVNNTSIGATVTRVFDDSNVVLASGVTSVRIRFWPVSNTQKVFWDQWLGPQGCLLPPGADPATHFDAQDQDGYKRAFESPVIKEIDILAARAGNAEICDNGADDDGDGLTDAADPECFGLSCPAEDCSNGLDDNGNTLTDCDDPDCLGTLACSPETCDNGVDDDSDGFVDCADTDCAAFPACQCGDPVFDVTGSAAANQPDGAVDMLDFAAFQRCISIGGSDFNAMPQVCRCMDRTGPGGVPDEVIDGNDLTLFMECATGPFPATPVSADCDD